MRRAVITVTLSFLAACPARAELQVKINRTFTSGGVGHVLATVTADADDSFQAVMLECTALDEKGEPVANGAGFSASPLKGGQQRTVEALIPLAGGRMKSARCSASGL